MTALERSTYTSDALAQRLFGAVLGAMDVQAAFLGDRLGWYRALAGDQGLTSTELADRTATAERYAREWLEHQAVTGILVGDRVMVSFATDIKKVDAFWSK